MRFQPTSSAITLSVHQQRHHTFSPPTALSDTAPPLPPPPDFTSAASGKLTEVVLLFDVWLLWPEAPLASLGSTFTLAPAAHGGGEGHPPAGLNRVQGSPAIERALSVPGALGLITPAAAAAGCLLEGGTGVVVLGFVIHTTEAAVCVCVCMCVCVCVRACV